MCRAFCFLGFSQLATYFDGDDQVEGRDLGRENIEVSLANLPEDGAGFGGGVGGVGDGAAYHYMRGSGGDSLGGSHYSGLVVGATASGAYSRSHDGKVVAKLFA